MKRLISLLLVCVMLFGAVSCTSSKKTADATDPDNVTTPEVTTPAATTPNATTPEQTTPEITTPEQTTPVVTDPPFDAIVYDFVKNFKNLEGTNFSLKMGHPVHGMVSVTTTWYNGDNEKVKCVATGKPLVGYWSGNSDGYHVDVCLIGDDIVWYPGVQLYNIIAFTAPEDGTYSYDFRTHSYWGCTHSSTKYRVEVNGSVHNGNEITYPKGTTAEGSATVFTGTVSLYKGEMIYFVYDPESDISSDNSQIDKVQVTYISDKMDDIPVFVPEKPNNPVVEFDYTDELAPIWQGNTVYDEVIMLVGKNDAAPLLYPATEIVSITNFTGTKTFVEGKDYVYENGMIKMPEGSSLTYCPETTYWKKHNYDVYTYNDKGELAMTMAGPGNTLPQYQLKVTYKHNATSSISVPDKSETFKDVIAKLERGEDVTIIFFGDSITEGWDNTLKSGIGPYMPPWSALVVQYLANKYEYQINYVKQDTTTVTGAWNYPNKYQVSFGNRGTIHYINTAVGGYTAQTALDKFGTHVSQQIERYGCDIMFYAFGMNTGGQNAKGFANLANTFAEKVFAKAPDVKLVMVSSMLPNTEGKNDGVVQYQEEALKPVVKALQDAGHAVELAPLQSVHKVLDSVKRYRETSGNNMNHPGDYLHRIYAQVALETICGYSKDYQ